VKYLAFLFSVLLLVGVMGCVETPTDTLQQPIYNGRAADSSEFYSTVSVARGPETSNHCTGTVLAPKLVLTASHCVVNGYDTKDPSELRIVEKTLDLDGRKDSNVFEIEKIVNNSDWPCNGNPEDDIGVGEWCDIALIITKEPLTTLPMPVYPMDRFDSLVQNGSSVILSGYGRTETYESGVLFLGESVFNYRSDHEMWIGAPDVTTPCYGDSGGPVYVEDSNGRMYVVGVASRLGYGYSCGDGAIYTFASAYEEWITDNSDGHYPPANYEEPPVEPNPDKCSTSGGSTGFILFTLLGALFIVRRRRSA